MSHLKINREKWNVNYNIFLSKFFLSKCLIRLFKYLLTAASLQALTAALSARRPSALTDIDTTAPTIVASRRAKGLGIPRQTREISVV